MIVLAHRGWWTTSEEKNSLGAFERAFAAGHGAELDVRDLDGGLFISHDPPRRGALELNAVLRLYRDYEAPGRLAINVKADGLQPALAASLALFSLEESAFVFDMSVPDMRAYLGGRVQVFTRYSEEEAEPAFYAECQGVWVDSFQSRPASSLRAVEDLRRGKSVAMVSPELHKRDHAGAWAEWLADFSTVSEIGRLQNQLMVCTDLPDAATRAFEKLQVSPT